MKAAGNFVCLGAGCFVIFMGESGSIIDFVFERSFACFAYGSSSMRKMIKIGKNISVGKDLQAR